MPRLSPIVTLLCCACAPASTSLDGNDAIAAPLEPRVSAHGSDLSDLPQQYPDGSWLPIDAPLLSMAVLAPVVVNGEKITATLDTGAMATTMSRPVAEKIGIVGEDMPRGRPVRAIDAHGSVIMGEKVLLGELKIGAHTWRDVDVTVLGDAPDLFLIGAEVLRDVDLFIAGDEGLIGVFGAGRAPFHKSDIIVSVDKGERQLVAKGFAMGSAGEVQFDLIVDTGAWNTSVPLLVGINGGLPADLRYQSTTVAVGGEQENRGRFLLDPLKLGRDKRVVGKVLAIGSTLEDKPTSYSDGGGPGMGLLGNDVLMRHHTAISFQRGELRFRRPPPRGPERTRGPGGVACQETKDGKGARVPCIKVAVVENLTEKYDEADLPNACLKIDVDKAYSGKTIELAITGDSGDLFNGGAIRAFLTANDAGAHVCAHLWRQLDSVGVKAGTPLSLRWVRTEGVQWPCDPMKTRCITFTGPLARLPIK